MYFTVVEIGSSGVVIDTFHRSLRSLTSNDGRFSRRHTRLKSSKTDEKLDINSNERKNMLTLN